VSSQSGGTEQPGVPVRLADAGVALSTASVYPDSLEAAFAFARDLGYDGVELMVWTDPVSQDVDAVADLVQAYQVPVLAVHSPCLIITQRVWSPDPWVRLTRSVQAAQQLGAGVVVVHPPFRWQREYARDFVTKVSDLSEETGTVLAVENMFPWRAGGRELAAYLPDWNPTDEAYRHCTLDLSHTAVSGTDALQLADDLGDRLAHVHLADGTGSARDEHLVPGRGTQPCDELLERLARDAWQGTIVLEVTTRRAKNRDEREADLAEALAYTRLHLAAALTTDPW
jgi:sugar phosphate isomerase/epimerase